MTAARGAKAKAKLLAPHLPEDDVAVPRMDVVVRVRGLSRVEVLALSDGDGDGDEVTPDQIEVRMLALGMVDPEMTEAEIQKWRVGGLADEADTVLRKVEELSGMRKETAKAAWKEMESDPDAEFRDVPGGEAGDDSGPPPG